MISRAFASAPPFCWAASAPAQFPVLFQSFSDEVNDKARRYEMQVFACPDDGLKHNEWPSLTWARIRGNYEKLRRQLGSGKVAERVANVIAERISSGQPQTKG